MRKTIALILAVAILAAGAYIARSMRPGASAAGASKAAALPARFAFLKQGITEQDVAARLGQPSDRKTNPRYQVKTAQQWAAIEKAMNEPASDPNAAPSLAAQKAAAAYEHRIKDIWSYDADAGSVILTFDGTSRLIAWNAVNASGARPK